MDMDKRIKPIEELKKQYNEYQRIKYPNVPYLCDNNAFKRINTTNGLTACIVIFLKLQGWQSERISNTGRPIDNTKIVTDYLGGRRRIGTIDYIKGTGQKGTADISATIDGRSVKIEVKNQKTKDRMSDSQKEYQSSIDITGGVYFVAKSFDDFFLWYTANYKKNPRYLEFYKVVKM